MMDSIPRGDCPFRKPRLSYSTRTYGLGPATQTGQYRPVLRPIEGDNVRLSCLACPGPVRAKEPGGSGRGKPGFASATGDPLPISETPKLRARDHLFWVLLSRLWKGWRSRQHMVQPGRELRHPLGQLRGDPAAASYSVSAAANEPPAVRPPGQEAGGPDAGGAGHRVRPHASDQRQWRGGAACNPYGR